MDKAILENRKYEFSGASINVNFLLSNVRSIKKHQDDLEALISSLESPINILFLTETWLNENDNINMYKIKGFQTVISNSRNTRGGGTMIQLDEKVNLIDRFECSLPESVAILAEIGGNKIILIVAYIPPRYDKNKFIEELDKELEILAQKNIPIVLAGDFNINTLRLNNLQQSYLNSITANGFELLAKGITRLCESTESCLDHFITRKIDNPIIRKLDNECFSDHYPVTLQTDFNERLFDINNSYRDMSFLMKEKTLSDFNQFLKQKLETTNLVNNDNIDDAYEEFYKCLFESVELFAPIRNKTLKTKSNAPWFNKKVKISISKRNRLYKVWKYDKLNTKKKEAFIQERHKVEKLIRVTKNEYYYSRFKKCIGDSRQIFKVLNEVTGKSTKRSRITNLSVNGEYTSDIISISNCFNEYFATIGEKLADSRKPVNEILTNHDSDKSIFLFNCYFVEVINTINDLKPKQTCGIDEISNLLLIRSCYVIAPYLTYLCNLSFNSGIFPKNLKLAKILPLHKAESRSDMNNYRPIALLSSISKVFEKLMHSRIYNYLEKFDLLYDRQFGFRQKYATIDALEELTERIRLGNDKIFNCSLFIDLKKAFDTLDHKILLSKWKNMEYVETAIIGFKVISRKDINVFISMIIHRIGYL